MLSKTINPTPINNIKILGKAAPESAKSNSVTKAKEPYIDYQLDRQHVTASYK